MKLHCFDGSTMSRQVVVVATGTGVHPDLPPGIFWSIAVEPSRRLAAQYRNAGAALRSGTLALLLLAGAAAPALAGGGPPRVTGGTVVRRGEYLVRISGCNDCHTLGWAEHPGEIPVAQQLTGTAIGWHGPWGTSFPVNLRLLVAGMSEQQWRHLIKTFHPRPPMPAYNLQSMRASDQGAIFAYIKSLGPAGKPAPLALPPGPPPPPPFFSLTLPPLPPK